MKLGQSSQHVISMGRGICPPMYQMFRKDIKKPRGRQGGKLTKGDRTKVLFEVLVACIDNFFSS